MDSNQIGFEVVVDQSYEQTMENITAALKAEGFGVLTRIDVQATMKEKLGVDFRPYAILGACNPSLAYRALSTDPLTGLLLPCNITVESTSDQHTIVRIADPLAMLSIGTLGENETLRQISSEAQTKLKRVAQSLAHPG